MIVTDDRARGLADAIVDPLRYEHQPTEPYESAGLILSLVPIGSRVLDVGCGTGSLSVLLRELRDCRVVGVEPNAERCQAAAARGLEVVNAELTATLLDELGQFDVILFADVLEHLVDPAEILALASRSLKRNGCIVASVPNIAHWVIRANLLRGRFEYQSTGPMDSTHLRWFTLRGLERLFTTAGFTILDTRGSAGLWLPAYRRRLPWRVMPAGMSRAIALFGIWVWPEMFSCQHVVRAVPLGGAAI